MANTAALSPVPLAGAAAPITLSVWRRCLIVSGAAVGLVASFPTLFYATLPFFLLPWVAEFGWGRADVASVSVLAMLGAAVGAPLMGKLFQRFGTERVILSSVLLFVLGMLAMTQLPPNLVLLGTLCFAIGLAGSGTTMVGYLSILPRWFDAKLGLALGCAGLGGGIGVALAPFLATRLIGQFGWRGAYAGLAAIALVAGLLAWMLISVRGQGRVVAAAKAATADAAVNAHEGLTLAEALRQPRFWLLMTVVFLTTFSLLGAAVHGATLFSDRGLTTQQAAIGAGLAGVGAMLARVGVGALLDRFFGPRIAMVVFCLGALGLFVNSTASAFAVMVAATFLGGMAMGAEGDLLPYFVRRYFGTRAFGAIFGVVFVAYTLGGMLGPIAYGLAFDKLGGYTVIMQIASAACIFSALALTLFGPYRFLAAARR